jgi:hypothetical protein
MQHSFQGSLTARDCKRHISHRFVVPAHAGQVRLHLRFAPYRVYGVSNMLTLTVFDPTGFRGAGHRGGDSHQVCIGADGATPGYLPGPLPAGEWTAQIDTHMIMPGEPVHYELEVALGEEESVDARLSHPLESVLPRPPLRGAGWYRGDLHTHTDHSDAGDRTVAELVQSARECGMDFVFLTDHNTISGLGEMDALPAGDLLTASGIELTTFWGHALCLGTRTWVDWRVRPGTGDMARIAAEVEANDQLFVIAHPLSAGDPRCTGCTWRYGEMMPGAARLVEIWNGPWGGDSGNEGARTLWHDWLNQGLRMVATAGTDTHHSRDYTARPGLNVIYAEELSEAALLRALRAGHLYLSTGPQVAFRAQDQQGRQWMMGDTVALPAEFTLAWQDCPEDAQVRLFANGRLLDRWTSGTDGRFGWRMSPDQADWVAVEIRDGGGEMLAATNPIFFASGGMS